MLTVLGPPRFDHFDRSIVSNQRKFHVIDAVTDIDLRKESRGVFSIGRGLVEHPVYLVEKTDG